MNKQTANEYYAHLSNFEKFLVSQYGNNINLDRFVEPKKSDGGRSNLMSVKP